LRNNAAKGKSRAKKTERAGHFDEPDAIAGVGEAAVSTVTAIVAVPPRGATLGRTLQVVFAGAPEQPIATLPDSPASELSNIG
jgi:hypothetical protein